MNEEHKNALESSLHVLCQDLDAEDVLPFLRSKGIVKEGQVQELMKITRKSTQNMQLIDFVKGAGPSAFQEFINALHFCDKKYLVDMILAHLPSSSTQQTLPESIITIQQSLKEMYLTRLQKVYPFSLPFTFDIENTWVSLALKEDQKNSQATEDHAELLERAFNTAKLLIIEGDPATGKTCLMRRLAYEWAKGKQELLHYNLVLYAEFRELREETFQSIADLVLAGLEKYLTKEGYENLKMLVNNERFCKENRILVLLDGYDESSLEKQCSELSSYVKEKTINKQLLFNIVITTRKGYLSNLRGREGRFVFAEVLGFVTKQQKEKYIHNHFLSSEINNKRNIAAVHQLLNKNKNLNKLAETPLFLTFICLIHERIIDGTLLELYCNIIWWLIDRHQQDFPDRDIPALFGFQSGSSDKFEIIQDHYLHFPQLHCLGKMALRKLKENVFTPSDCAEYNLQPTIEQAGLLRKEKSYDNLFKLITSFRFPHRTIQEFLAAFYCFCSNDPTSEWLLPDSKLETIVHSTLNLSGMNEFESFLFRMALSDKVSVQTEKRKYYFDRITEMTLNMTFDAFNTTAGFDYELLNWFLWQCTNVQKITLRELTIKRHARTMLNVLSVYNESTTPNMSCPTLLTFSDLIKLQSVEFSYCTFSANYQLSFANCPSLKNLKFDECEMKSNANFGIATLPAIDTVRFQLCTFSENSQLSFTNCSSLKELIFDRPKIKNGTIVSIVALPAIDTVRFEECTFSANSQLSLTNCPSLKKMEFDQCKMESNTIVGIATLPAIDTVEFSYCSIDMATWQLITEQINNSSVKYLQLTFGRGDFNKEILIHLQECSNVDKMEISIENYTIHQNDLLSFSDLIKLHSLTFGYPLSGCTFSVDSQLSFTNCPSLKNLQFNLCEMKSSTIVGIATLPAIDKVEFSYCSIDMATWQSVTEQISNSNVKYFKLTFGKHAIGNKQYGNDFNKEFLIHLQLCKNVDRMDISIYKYTIHQNDLLSFSDLIKLHSLTFGDAISRCTFSANSQLSLNNCPSLKNLKFCSCRIESSANLGIATLPAIDTLGFHECSINLLTCQSITDQIRNSTVKCLQLTLREDFGELLIHLQLCNNVEQMDITIWGYTIRQNDLLSFSHLVKLHSLTFGGVYSNVSWGCTFSASSQLSFTNCPSLKKLKFDECKMESSTIAGIATLPAIDTVIFDHCNIDLATWQSITDQISNSTVKYLHLPVDLFVEGRHPGFLHHLHKCGRIQQIHVQDVWDSSFKSILNRIEEEVTENLVQTAQKLPALTSLTLADPLGKRLKESRRLSERNRERIVKAGQQSNPHFSIKYVE